MRGGFAQLALQRAVLRSSNRNAASAGRLLQWRSASIGGRKGVGGHLWRPRCIHLNSPTLKGAEFQQARIQTEDDTIYALSTAAGRAAIAVIRVSGSACREVYTSLCPNRPFPKPRYATLRTLYEPGHNEAQDAVLDSGALVMYFPSPNTVTGEDMLELHVHGGPAIVKAVLSAIPKCTTQGRKIRYAEPGEFTRRAFMNDKLSLTQVEALSDSLSASTEQQRRLSVRGTTSALATRYETWRQQLLYARGELEALIDFSEDQHFDESPATLAASVAAQVKHLKRDMRFHCANAVRGEMLRNGISIALLGAPNAGKSSLLNRIVGREAAIVSREAGTTRDVVEVGIDLGGWYCRLGDTAGLRRNLPVQPPFHADGGDEGGLTGLSRNFRESPVADDDGKRVGEVEQEGVRRAKQRALESDLVIVVLSLEEDPVNSGARLVLDTEVTETAVACHQRHGNVVVVVNKLDRQRTSDTSLTTKEWSKQIEDAIPGITEHDIFFISCRDSANALASGIEENDPGRIQALLDGLMNKFKDMTAAIAPDDGVGGNDSDASVWQESLGTTQRQKMLLEECMLSLDQFLEEVAPPEDIEHNNGEDPDVDIVVAAESLRAAADCLARITGKGEAGDVEEVLGVVFEK